MATKKTTVIVTLDEQHLNNMPQVAEKCRSVGLEVSNSLEFLGQITGDIDPERESLLRQIPGVLSVEQSQEYELPPPDSEVQ